MIASRGPSNGDTIASTGGGRDRAYLILHGGKVVTVDQDFSVHQAVVVRDGKVVAVGPNEVAASYDAPRMINLQGRTLMPGFIDTHVHIRGRAARFVDLTRLRSLDELKSRVRDMAQRLGEGE